MFGNARNADTIYSLKTRRTTNIYPAMNVLDTDGFDSRHIYYDRASAIPHAVNALPGV